MPGEWSFAELTGPPPPRQLEGVIAAVRHGSGWSVLRPTQGDEPERLRVFSIHFPADVDNSGFISWLAGTLKAHTGTGVVVVCGQNLARGGVFDYWGVPVQAAEEVLALVEELRGPDEATTV